MKKEKLEEIREKIKGCYDKAKEKIKSVGAKKVIATVCALFVISGAVVLNFVLFRESPENGEEKKQMAIDLSTLTDGGESEKDEVSADVELSGEDYFATISLGRQQARDEAMEVLLEVTENENALSEAKQAAMTDINRIASEIEKEGTIEAMVKAKGFEKCIAVISGENASVVVSADVLTPGQSAQISEIVYEAAGILPVNLTIIEKSLA